MSFIRNTPVDLPQLKKAFEYSKQLDPSKDDVDMLGCNYKGIRFVRYLNALDTVVFNYTDKNQGLQNVLVFCDIPTATELDFNLDLIKDLPDINMSEYFEDNFAICWNYVNPKIYRLFCLK